MTTGDQAEARQKQTRYQRVQAILNQAQGDATPNYQGYKRFWELPLEEFLTVTIYGIRMIAPPGEMDFCEEQMQAPAAAPLRCGILYQRGSGSFRSRGGGVKRRPGVIRA